MKKILLITIICLLTCQYSHATPLRPDTLFYKDKIHGVYGFYLTRKMHINRLDFLKRNGFKKKEVFWLDDPDGMHITLALKDGKLYLTKIDIDEWEFMGKPSYEDFFGVNIPKGGLFAYWFSGELISPSDPYSISDESSLKFYFRKGLLFQGQSRNRKPE